MPKPPVLSGREIVSGLHRLGFVLINQRGSHIKLRKGDATVIVPDHREVRRGTLSSILRMGGVSIEDSLGAISQ